jgi:hypothetical protein
MVSSDAIEAFRKQDPLFCEFLLETGRIVSIGVDHGKRTATR